MTNPNNRLTGQPVNDRQQHHLDAIEKAGEALFEAMHFADGSAPPGEHQEHVFTGMRMRRAADNLEMVLMLARKAALEV